VFCKQQKKNEEHHTRTIYPSRITNIFPCVALSDNNDDDDDDDDGNIDKNM
jgi:hypothetical protein